MKKFLAIVYIVIVFLIIYLIQSNFFSWFNILEVKPNLFIIFALILGLFLGREYGFFFGIIFGLLLDIFCSNMIGINAITLGVVGFLAGILEKNFSREHKFTLLFITTILTFLGELIKYILILSTKQATVQIVAFGRILLIEIIYNILLAIIIYPAIVKFGEKLSSVLITSKKQIKYF